MTIRVERIMSSQEFHDLNEHTKAQGMYSTDSRVFKPGMAWEMDWYFDPSGARERDHKVIMFKASYRDEVLNGMHLNPFLSLHYWKDWSHIRPPVCVVCPDGKHWEIDRRSLRGDGWKVTGNLSGEFPDFSVAPSVDNSPYYHGFLKNGMFTPDLNRKYI